jgi:hypothetical protein
MENDVNQDLDHGLSGIAPVEAPGQGLPHMIAIERAGGLPMSPPGT